MVERQFDDAMYIELGTKIEAMSNKQTHSQVTTIEYDSSARHYKIIMAVEILMQLINGIEFTLSTDISMRDTNKDNAIANCLLAVSRVFTKDASYYKNLVNVYLEELNKHIIEFTDGKEVSLEDLFDANSNTG